MKGIITDLQRYSLHDGPGIRTTVFMKGCNLHCPWCHNPEAQSPEISEWYFRDQCVGCGHCAEGCPTGARRICGTQMDSGALFRLLLRDLPFYGTNGGVTFSGGEPLLQACFLSQILPMCKEYNISTCIQTALCVDAEQLLLTIENTDIYLVDVKVLTENHWQKYTGGDPSLLSHNLSVLQEYGKRVHLRIPAVAGVNDTPEELESISGLVQKFSFVEQVDTLPIFNHAQRKYHALGREQSCKWFAAEPDRIAMEMADKLTLLTGRPIGVMQ